MSGFGKVIAFCMVSGSDLANQNDIGRLAQGVF